MIILYVLFFYSWKINNIKYKFLKFIIISDIKMDEQKFRKWLNEVVEVLKVFVAAKKDQWRTFVYELNKSDKEYINKQLEEYKSKKDSDKKVNGIRVKILEKLLEWNITFEEVDELFKKWKTEDWYWNRWTFWILYSLYYNRYKTEIVSFIEDVVSPADRSMFNFTHTP